MVAARKGIWWHRVFVASMLFGCALSLVSEGVLCAVCCSLGWPLDFVSLCPGCVLCAWIEGPLGLSLKAGSCLELLLHRHSCAHSVCTLIGAAAAQVGLYCAMEHISHGCEPLL